MEGASLSLLFRFITRLSNIPPMGLQQPVHLQYHDREFPYFAACTNTVVLPTCHERRDAFFSAFKKAFDFGGGFGSAKAAFKDIHAWSSFVAFISIITFSLTHDRFSVLIAIFFKLSISTFTANLHVTSEYIQYILLL